jgi:uncharacterized oxidoreductase
MRLHHQTVLITGGSSGIGFALAKKLTDTENTVLICGRSASKLKDAAAAIPGVHTFQCDISNGEDRMRLWEWITTHHSSCSVLINNAAIVHRTNFYADSEMIQKTVYEVDTNLVAPIALTKMLLPLFATRKYAAVINITTGLIYAPRAVYPIYNATKAALHSFTQVLRHQIKDLPVDVIEVMMPVVATPWHKGDVPKIAISAEQAVNEMFTKMERGLTEIRVAKTQLLYILSRIAPAFAFKKINQIS